MMLMLVEGRLPEPDPRVREAEKALLGELAKCDAAAKRAGVYGVVRLHIEGPRSEVASCTTLPAPVGRCVDQVVKKFKAPVGVFASFERDLGDPSMLMPRGFLEKWQRALALGQTAIPGLPADMRLTQTGKNRSCLSYPDALGGALRRWVESVAIGKPEVVRATLYPLGDDWWLEDDLGPLCLRRETAAGSAVRRHTLQLISEVGWDLKKATWRTGTNGLVDGQAAVCPPASQPALQHVLEQMDFGVGEPPRRVEVEMPDDGLLQVRVSNDAKGEPTVRCK
ncbi:MAG: hypothetical protein Q8L14_35770 [Myxococcales bacterium]|nr:hypothetical protein [Myxococcales bacterium]